MMRAARINCQDRKLARPRLSGAFCLATDLEMKAQADGDPP